MEKYDDAISQITEKTGISIHDVRDANSIFTTKDCIKTDLILPTTPANLIASFLRKKQKPIPRLMYTNEMIDKVATLYLDDILLYMNSISGSKEEFDSWLH